MLDYEISGKLQERVYRRRIHVDQLKSRLIEEWEHFHQVFIDEAIRHWRPRLLACSRAQRGHLEHKLQLCLIFCTQVHTDRHVCAVAIVDALCFGVTSLDPL